jgi:hypothetical protein
MDVARVEYEVTGQRGEIQDRDATNFKPWAARNLKRM